MDIDPNYHNTYKEFLTELECGKLSTFIQKHADYVMGLDNPYDQGYTGLTGQHTVYNWLVHPEFQRLNIPQRLYDLPDFKDITNMTIQSWCNIIRQGERLHTHRHGNLETFPEGFYAINVFVSGNLSTGTHYADTGYTPNTVGDIHIISSELDHKVPSHLFREPRVSFAMDVYTHPRHIEYIRMSLKEGQPLYPDTDERRFLEYTNTDGNTITTIPSDPAYLTTGKRTDR